MVYDFSTRTSRLFVDPCLSTSLLFDTRDLPYTLSHRVENVRKVHRLKLSSYNVVLSYVNVAI